jgi:putative Holliday junction resolvase
VEALLGFDFGPRKIGVAVGQTVTASASPLTTLHPRKGRPDWDAIARLIGEWQPKLLVVGLPFDLDDTEAEAADGAKRFARQLEGRFRLTVHLVDERLSSREARSQLGKQATSREVVDAMAAKLILETWLSEYA